MIGFGIFVKFNREPIKVVQPTEDKPLSKKSTLEAKCDSKEIAQESDIRLSFEAEEFKILPPLKQSITDTKDDIKARTQESGKSLQLESEEEFKKTLVKKIVTKDVDKAVKMIESSPLASLNEPLDDLGMRIIHQAVFCNLPQLLNYLVSRGVDLNVQSNNGMSPLYYVAFIQNYELVKILVEAGADVNLPAPFTGDTPLHALLYHSENSKDGERILDVLVAKGANLNAKNSNGLTPLEIAQKHRPSWIPVLSFKIIPKGEAKKVNLQATP